MILPSLMTASDKPGIFCRWIAVLMKSSVLSARAMPVAATNSAKAKNRVRVRRMMFPTIESDP